MPTPATSQEKQASRSNDFAVSVLAGLLESSKQAGLWRARNAASLVIFVGACAVWLAGLARLGVHQEGLPWYLCITFVAVFSVRFLRPDTSQKLSLVGLPRSKAPLKLKESLSLCYMVMAVALYSFIGYGLLQHLNQQKKAVQVVDIQLLSDRDFQDNKALLPGTQVQEDLRKRQADLVSRPGSLNQPPVAPARPESKKTPENVAVKQKEPNKSAGKEEVAKQEEQPAQRAKSPDKVERKLLAQASPALAMPLSWQTKTIDPNFVPAAQRPASPARLDSLPYISEVSPPEMVELMDNDGDANGMHVFQKGGRSNGGKGADNSLSEFLKDLNKRIKSCWSPPPGDSRVVELTFRLKKDGRLAFMKITRSSGVAEIDSSASRAVAAAAARGQALPKDYAANYLDVLYTFKYNVDELQEIGNSSGNQSSPGP